ncbi:MAG: PD-(D/E)XK nuclease family protein, partial [Xanthomonadales bacterium]|nr:PD-(D/E)XK nuclease family protein [Xanthomonadales bacterium]
MMIFEPEKLFERLQSGHTLVTGNSRLARVLAGQYGQWRVNRGDRQWSSPQVLSWNAWLGRLWERAGLEGITGTGFAVLSPRQSASLWEQVLGEADNTGTLLRPESLARQAMETRQLAVGWKLDMNHPAWTVEADNENYHAFHAWNRAFEKRCREGGWIPSENRSMVLVNALCDGCFSAPGAIDLLGFDEFTPAQQDLLAALEQAGTPINHAALEPAGCHAALWKSRSAEDELQAMARWVRHWYESEPGSSIAVVVPDLQARRSQVERQLQQVLTPGMNPAYVHARPWNISMGTALARIPMIESAFDLLKMLAPKVEIQDVGRILRSPWIRGGVSERGQRALLEKCLRENYPRQLRLSEVRYRAGELRKYDRDHRELPAAEWTAQAWNCPQLLTLINALMEFSHEQQAPRAASAWAEAFDSLLSGLGWPLAAENEGAGVSATEHDHNWQAFQAWRDALRELASLDATVQKMRPGQAIAQLYRICQEQVFQARTPPASIQVLGLYEASGLRFDHLWVLGLNSANWPPASRPNPFIPRALQAAADIPHSGPQRELEVARSVTLRLLETARDAVFSFPGQSDGEEVLPSPLLTGQGLTLTGQVPGWSGKTWQDLVFEGAGPVTGELEMPGSLSRHTERGGTSILKNQALCPFRAFASNRLGADRLETPVDGISAMLHGSLVHRVLENFWLETQSQEAMLALPPEDLADRLNRHIETVLDEERGLMFRPEFRGVEASRLNRLVWKYLELEKTRQPFVVEGFEREILHDIE